jgi:hypothetical protein
MLMTKYRLYHTTVTSEVHEDGTMLKRLVNNASENNDVKRVIADGAYDSKENFRHLFHSRIEAAVKVRKNSNRLTVCCHSKIIALQQLKNLKCGRLKLSTDLDG